MATARQWSQKGHEVGPLVGPWELYGKEARLVPLFGAVNSSVGMNVISTESVPFLAENVIGSLMLLAQESKDPVKALINSHGGSVVAGLNIIEAFEHLQAKGIEVWTIVLGVAMSMGSVILAAGTEGKRFALKRSTVHLHSGTVGMGEMKPEDAAMLQKYFEEVRMKLNTVLSERTKIPDYHVKHEEEANPKLLETPEGRIKLVRAFLEKEQFLSPEQALEAGIIDRILCPGDPIIDQIYHLPGLSARQGGNNP